MVVQKLIRTRLIFMEKISTKDPKKKKAAKKPPVEKAK